MSQRASSKFGAGPLGKPPTAINNAHSAGGVSCNLPATIGKQVLSGALTASTYKSILNVSGQGVFNWASVLAQDSTSRTVSLRVTIDGTIVFAATSNTISSANAGITTSMMAQSNGSLSNYAAEKMPFNSSLLVEIAESLSETNTLALAYSYYGV